MIPRISVTALAAAATVSAAIFATPAAAVPAAPAARAQARVPAATAAIDIVLFGVSCASASRCLAVGQETTNSSLGLDFAQAWNGRKWRVLRTPSPGSIAGLNGVACTSPAACIAVGGYSGTGPGHTLAVAWNGQRWRVLTTPSPGNSELNAIACPRPTHCIAVGESFTGLNRRTLAEVWNGTSWRVLPAADAHSDDATLASISCAQPDRCMATGHMFNSASDGTTALAESWNGIRWRVLPTPSPGSELSDLTGVSCRSPARCIAAGGYLNRGQPFPVPLSEMWNGSRWRVLPTPSAGMGSGLGAVSCPGTADCIAIGAEVTRAGTGLQVADEWNGTRWRSLRTTSLGTAEGNLLSVSCPRVNRCVAVGDIFGKAGAGVGRPLAEEWNGSRWRLINQ